MNTLLKPCMGIVVLALGITACSTPYPWQSTTKPAPKTKAPVVDRTARRQPAYPAQSPQSSRADVGRMPQEDPLSPRESSPAYSATPNAYGQGYVPPTAAPAYPDDYDSTPPQPYSSNSADPYRQPSPPRSTGNDYQPPAYPPGAATPSSSGGRPNAIPGSLPEPQAAVVPQTPRVKPPTAPAPAPVPPPAPAGTSAPAETAVAMTTPPAASAPEPAPPAPRPAQPAPPPKPPAELPPTEISRDGNQAVVALLESADNYVKSNQLDKAGAALERALRIEPRNAGIWHDLAQIRLHQGQYQQAESLAVKSNNLASGNRTLQSKNWNLIGFARKATGNTAGAEEAEARASQLSH